MSKRKRDVSIIGNTAKRIVDGADVLRRAIHEWDRTEKFYRRAQEQIIQFRQSNVAITFVADAHIGSAGVDYRRLFREAKLMRDTPNLYIVLVGDLIDNFIVQKLYAVRHDTRINIEDEYILLKQYLELVAPKLVASVSGNHEAWTHTLAGIPYYQDILAQVAPEIIYDSDDVQCTVRVGKTDFKVRVRHQWNGNSIYNPTHGIERASKFDGRFQIGVGAHTHMAGVARQSVVDGMTVMSILCGSYKSIDPYARTRGFYRPNGSTAVTVLLDESGAMVGIDRLEFAGRIMRALGKSKRGSKK